MSADKNKIKVGDLVKRAFNRFWTHYQGDDKHYKHCTDITELGLVIDCDLLTVHVMWADGRVFRYSRHGVTQCA